MMAAGGASGSASGKGAPVIKQVVNLINQIEGNSQGGKSDAPNYNN